MTTSVPHTHVRVRDLSELVAGIPYMIGFPPTDSLVLFTFRRCPNLALSTTIRVDLPKPEHVVLVADELTAAVVRNEAVAVIAVVVGDTAEQHEPLIELLRKTLAHNEILLTHASWVRKVDHGEQWQCYEEPLCGGVVPDPQSSALAAAVAVAGGTTYPNREAVAAHLAPDPDEALARRKELLSVYRMASAHSYTKEDLAVDLLTVGVALDRTAQSYDPPTLADHQLVRLADALSRTQVRDECLAVVLSEESESGERLWSALVRALPAPERAEPAFLLAMSAYLRGAGVLASLALKIVLESKPEKELAVLLDRALRMGVPPDRLRGMLFQSFLNNNKTAVEPDDEPPWDTTPESPHPSPPPPPTHPEPTTPEPTTPWQPTHESPASAPSFHDEPVAWEIIATSPQYPSGSGEPARDVATDFVTSGTEPEFPTNAVPATVETPVATGTASPSAVASEAKPADREYFTVPAPAFSEALAASAPWPPSPSTSASPTEVREDQECLAQPVVADAPTTHAVMDALAAFLPPPTERSGPV